MEKRVDPRRVFQQAWTMSANPRYSYSSSIVVHVRRALENTFHPDVERLSSLARHRDLLFSAEREKSCYVADPRATEDKNPILVNIQSTRKRYRGGMEFPFVSLSRNTWDGIIIAPSAHPKIYFFRDYRAFLFCRIRVVYAYFLLWD